MREPLDHLRRNAVAYLALFLAVGTSGAYAAGQLAKNSVGTGQLRKNAVVSSKVKNGSLRAVDFAAGQLPRGAAGAAGAPGPPGAPGPAGSAGAAGAAGAPVAVRAYAYVNSGAHPSLDPARSKGFASVTSPSTGVYCLRAEPGIDLKASVPIVTAVFNTALLSTGIAQPVDSSRCQPDEIRIITYLPSSGSVDSTEVIDFTVAVP